MPDSVVRAVNNAVPSIIEKVGASASVVLTSIAGWVVFIPWLVLIPILSFFLLKDADTFRRSALHMLPRGRWRWRGDEFFQDVNSTRAAYTRAQLTAHRARNRHRVLRITVEVVRRPVEGVDDPDDLAGREVGTQLLSDDARARDGAGERLGDHPLGGAIDVGDEVVPPFFRPVLAVRRGRGAHLGRRARGRIRGNLD